MAIGRLHDYPERLAAFIESRRGMPFEWGINDCCLFAADGVLAQTGVDLAADWRGYTSAREAAQLIDRVGGLPAFAHALAEKPVARAFRGEVVLVALDGRDTFGLVAGNGHWCGPGAEGVVFRPMSEALRAFGF
jgi:hypothetical protein